MGKVLIGLGWMEGGGAGLPGVCQHRVECNHEGEINHCCIPPPNTNIPHSGRAKSKCQARHRSSAICVNIEQLLSVDGASIPTSDINEPAASSNAGCFAQSGHGSNLPENCNYQLWTQWRDILYYLTVNLTWLQSPGEGLLPVLPQCRAPGLTLPLQPGSVSTQYLQFINSVSTLYILSIYSISTQTLSVSTHSLLDKHSISTVYLLRSVWPGVGRGRLRGAASRERSILRHHQRGHHA